jgi:benzoyl-CoA reductase subunit C
MSRSVDDLQKTGSPAEDVLSVFAEAARDPYGTIGRWKRETGKKIVACMPMQIPEEIVHAAGAIPVVLPENKEPITIASKHIQSFFCGYARSVIDAALKGRYEAVDGMIFQDTCHTMRPMFDIIHANCPIPFMQRIFLPLALAKPQARTFLLTELEGLKRGVGEFTGKVVDDQSLRESIDIYNENRDLMIRLYDLRRERPEIVSLREMINVNLAGMVMPKEAHSDLLKELLPLLAARKPPLGDGDNRIRLVLTGSLCEAPPDELLDSIEELGAIVADDDLYTGSRYFLSKVPPVPDPTQALAEAYLRMVAPCPTRIYPKLELGPYLVDMARKAKAKGVLIIMVKFCEAHDYTYPHMRRAFDAAGIPYLMMKTEHETTSVEQLKTRLQAFLEIVRGR